MNKLRDMQYRVRLTIIGFQMHERHLTFSEMTTGVAPLHAVKFCIGICNFPQSSKRCRFAPGQSGVFNNSFGFKSFQTVQKSLCTNPRQFKSFTHVLPKTGKANNYISIDLSRPARCGTSIIFKRMRPHRELVEQRVHRCNYSCWRVTMQFNYMLTHMRASAHTVSHHSLEYVTQRA